MVMNPTALSFRLCSGHRAVRWDTVGSKTIPPLSSWNLESTNKCRCHTRDRKREGAVNAGCRGEDTQHTGGTFLKGGMEATARATAGVPGGGGGAGERVGRGKRVAWPIHIRLRTGEGPCGWRTGGENGIGRWRAEAPVGAALAA